MKAGIRAKLMGMEAHDPETALRGLQCYMREIAAKDERRILWVVERAAEALAEAIEREEIEIVCHKEFNRKLEADKRAERLERLNEDFRLLWSLMTLCRESQFQRFANEFGQFIRRAQCD